MSSSKINSRGKRIAEYENFYGATCIDAQGSVIPKGDPVEKEANDTWELIQLSSKRSSKTRVQASSEAVRDNLLARMTPEEQERIDIYVQS